MSDIIILIGSPGSGKGTQAKILKNKLNFIHISTGDLLREEIKNKTKLGLEIKNIIDSGKLVNDNILQILIENVLFENKNYIFDGFPRNISQAMFLDDFIKKNNINLRKVVYLELQKEIIVKRILGRRFCNNCNNEFNIFKDDIKNNKCPICEAELFKRNDDNENTINQRLKIYFSEINKILDFYKDKNLLVINADENIKDISDKIIFDIKNY